METKHTPGPWKIGIRETIHGGATEVTAVGDWSGHVADVYACCADNREANARLIAAAPELFEIVDRIADLKQRDDGMLYGDEDYGYILEKARKLVAAIAKLA